MWACAECRLRFYSVSEKQLSNVEWVNAAEAKWQAEKHVRQQTQERLAKVREDLKEAAKFMLSDARRTLNMYGISDLEKADAEKQAAQARKFMKENP